MFYRQPVISSWAVISKVFHGLSYVTVGHLVHRKTDLKFISCPWFTGVFFLDESVQLSYPFEVVLENLFISVGSALTQDLFGCRIWFITGHTFLSCLEESAVGKNTHFTFFIVVFNRFLAFRSLSQSVELCVAWVFFLSWFCSDWRDEILNDLGQGTGGLVSLMRFKGTYSSRMDNKLLSHFEIK